MRLAFVHGRDQRGKDPRRLEAEWLAALERGWAAQHLRAPAGLQIAFPFYGDELDRLIHLDEAAVADAVDKGAAAEDEYRRFQREVLKEMQARAGISDDQIEAELSLDARERGPENWEWVQAFLRVLDRNLPDLGSAVVEALTRDVYIYLKRTSVRRAVNKIVSDTLNTAPTVVVAHSLGTVVAYDALRKDPRALNVPLYVTLGSPMGVELIRSQLAPIKFPKPPLGHWYNAYDERDVVALYPLDRDNFDVDPAIENSSRVNNHTGNRHGIDGYLDDPAVARRIHEALVAGG
jgi:hypothetical protein